MAKKKSSKKSSKKDAAPAETALATTEGPQIARNPEEIDKEWAEKINELKQRKLALASDTLQFYYDIGGLATELTNSAAQEPEYRKYGAHTSEELMVQLGLGKSTFYAAMQFVAFADDTQLDRMKATQMPWSAVQAWLTVEEAKKRESLLKKLESEKIKSRDDFRKAVDAAKGPKQKPEKKPPDGATLALSQAKSFNTFATQAESKALPGLVESLKVYKKSHDDMSEKTAEKFDAEVKEAKKHVATMERLLNSVKKALEAAGV